MTVTRHDSQVVAVLVIVVSYRGVLIASLDASSVGKVVSSKSDSAGLDS